MGRRKSDDGVEEQKEVATVALEWYERHRRAGGDLCGRGTKSERDREWRTRRQVSNS